MQNQCLFIEIIDDRRQREPFSLLIKGSDTPYIHQINEDDSLRLKTTLPKHWDGVELAISDQVMPPTEWHETEQGIEYIWEPQKYRNSYESYFRNYFGMANFEISAINSDSGMDEILIFSEIEVLAKKLNAERASQMLDYLFSKTFPLHAATSATKQKGGTDDGQGETPSQRLDALESICSTLEDNLPLIARKPLTRLRQKRVIEPVIGDNLNASESSIQWLACNTDELIPEMDKEHAHLQLNDQLYRVKRLAVQKPTISTDIPENRRILGVLRILQQQIDDLVTAINEKASGIDKYSSNSKKNVEYVSFFSCLSRHVGHLNQTRLDRCARLRSRLHRCILIFESNLEVKQPDLSITISAKARSHSAYRNIMLSALKLYGNIDWKQDDLYLAIHSIPKLYELYCLEQLKEVITKIPSIQELDNPKPAYSDERGQHGYYEWNNWKISLLYQPIYKTSTEGEPLTVVNSEGWTERNNGSLVKRRRNRREPDYVIDIQHSHQEHRHLIVLDAKYTNAHYAYSRDLPSLVMKYIHGLHMLKGGYSPVIGLFILFPENPARSYHHENFGASSTTIALPVLTTHSMSPKAPANTHNLEMQFHKLLTTISKNIKAPKAQKKSGDFEQFALI